MRIKRNWSVIQIALLAVLFVGCDMKKQDAKQVQHSDQQVAAPANGDEGDLHPGKALHDANCISCHDASAYRREVREVSDFPALLAQVRRCNANLSPRLDAKAIDQVVDYLNQTFYRYDKP